MNREPIHCALRCNDAAMQTQTAWGTVSWNRAMLRSSQVVIFHRTAATVSSVLLWRCKSQQGQPKSTRQNGTDLNVLAAVSKPKLMGTYSFLRSPSIVLGQPLTCPRHTQQPQRQQYEQHKQHSKVQHSTVVQFSPVQFSSVQFSGKHQHAATHSTRRATHFYNW